MRRLTLALVLACALTPATARANSGGFWDFLYGMDPKLTGFGADFHLTCRKPGGEVIKHCEEWFGLSPSDNPESFKELKHELNIRIAYYWEYGTSYDTALNNANPFNLNSLHAMTLMPMYVYHPDAHIAIGVGAGAMPFWGKNPANDSYSFWKFVATPMSLTYSPAAGGPAALKNFFLRGEATYIVDAISPSDFVKTLQKIERAGEWNVSLSVGYDFRRRRFGN